MSVDAETEAEIRAGIAAYAREQRVLLRLLRAHGPFTDQQFDRWFRSTRRRRANIRSLTGDTFILGLSRMTWSYWGMMLELLQQLTALGEVDARRVGERIIYRLTPKD